MTSTYIRNFQKIMVTYYSSGIVHHCARNVYGSLRSSLLQPQCPISRFKATLVQSPPNKGVVNKIIKKLGWLSFSRSRLRRSGCYLYESVADSVHYMNFFREFNMEDTFFSWFLITELHVWMLLVRVMAEGEEGRFLRNCIVEAMWEDVSTRAKKLEGYNTTDLKQQTIELSEQFQAAIVGYDEGLLSEDRVLAGAIWRRFFKQECADPEQVERLVKYIREQVKVLDDLPQEKVFFSSSVKWISLPPVENRNVR